MWHYHNLFNVHQILLLRLPESCLNLASPLGPNVGWTSRAKEKATMLASYPSRPVVTLELDAPL